MTFYEYMMDRHYPDGKSGHTGYTDSPEADLAGDMARDPDFPANTTCNHRQWHNIIRDHIAWHGGCAECLAVFEKYWKEYLEEMT